jgi:hypothetical protein
MLPVSNLAYPPLVAGNPVLIKTKAPNNSAVMHWPKANDKYCQTFSLCEITFRPPSGCLAIPRLGTLP